MLLCNQYQTMDILDPLILIRSKVSQGKDTKKASKPSDSEAFSLVLRMHGFSNTETPMTNSFPT